jgi:hypothetical protein
VQVHGSLADGAAAGQGHARGAAAGQQRAEHQHRGAHRLHQIVGRLGGRDLRHAQLETRACAAGLRGAHALQDADHRRHVAHLRRVLQHDRLGREQGSGHGGKHRVLRTADVEDAGKAATPSNPDLVHVPRNPLGVPERMNRTGGL